MILRFDSVLLVVSMRRVFANESNHRVKEVKDF